MYVHTRVGVHLQSCRQILFVCPVQCLYYMRVYYRHFFTNTCMRVWEGIGGGVFISSMFIISACCWCGRLCFGRGRDRGVVLYISLFLLRVVGGCVLVYAHTHTNYLRP